MSSVAARTRQNAPSHFMNISSLSGLIYAYTPVATSGNFSTATWASVGVNNPYLSTIATAGGLLKDLGKNIISSNRYFRKIQLTLPNGGPKPSTGASTFGVAGAVGTSPNVDYLTGYIELGYEGGGVPAPVVQFGTL
jgi:hypothetical protein